MLNRSRPTHYLISILVALSAALPAQAEVRRVTVAVDGLACPFCAFGVEKRLKKVAGVESVAVQAKEGAATLIAGEGESIAIHQVPDAVRKAGFTPGTLTVDVVGNVRTDQDRLALKVTGSDEVLLLTSSDSETEHRLRWFAEQRTVVIVLGPVDIRPEGLLAVSTESVEAVSVR